MTKTHKIIFYILTTLISLIFIMSGYQKLSADPMSVEGFAMAHLPLWFMYFIGATEVLGGIALWIPKLQKWSVYGLMIIMIGAVVVTALFNKVVFALAPIVFIALLYVLLKIGKKRGASPVTSAEVPPVATM
jgi:uncharacterized membrane protein YphA (DoxX/SURF4 family)